MKPEILLKAYVEYESEDAFRELVASSLDQVYSQALRIIPGPPHLVEETVLRVYWDLARKAPRLEEVVLACWLREHTCKMAVKVLREEDRSIDRSVLKKEKQAHSSSNSIKAAPPGLALRVYQGVLLNLARPKTLGLLLPPVRRPGWFRRARIGAGAVCVLATIVVWHIPLHKANPIVQDPELQLTPSSFAQLASPEESGVPPEPNPIAKTNGQTKSNQP